MARIAPMAKNGANGMGLNDGLPSSGPSLDTRMAKLERQMEKALKMLEVISLNTTPVARHSMHAPNATPKGFPDNTQPFVSPQSALMLRKAQNSFGSSDEMSLSGEDGGSQQSITSAPSTPLQTPKHHNSIHLLSNIAMSPNGIPGGAGSSTPPHGAVQAHSFFIPTEASGGGKDEEENEGGSKDHSTLGRMKIASMVKDTSRNLKRAQMKMKRDLKVGMDKISGKEVGKSRKGPLANSHHSHEAKHAILSSHPHMINPRGKFRLAWDMCLLMPLLLYLTFMMPFRICFANDPRIFTGGYWFEFMIEVVFVIDIILNFRTGYFISGLNDEQMVNNIEYHPLSVVRHYLRTWFILDLVSGIPFSGLDLVLRYTGGDAGGAADVPLLKMVKSLRLLRFLKLIRLLKIEEMTSNAIMDRDIIDRIEDFFQEGFTRSGVILLSLAMQLGFICHIGACIWVYIGRRGALKTEDSEHSWLYHEPSGPYSHEDTTGENGGDNVASIYLAAFYYCLTTMTSVGYGDIIPRSDAERTYAICLEFIGGFVFAMIIASLTSVVTSSDMNARKVSEQLDSVSSFVQNRQFPHSLGRRIRRHFRQFYSHKSAIDEKKIFGEMSSALRRDVSGYIVSVRMSDVKLFQSMNPKLWPRLFPLLNPTHFELGETLCTQGEECAEMFIILEGSLSGQTIIDTFTMNELLKESSDNVNQNTFENSNTHPIKEEEEEDKSMDENDDNQIPKKVVQFIEEGINKIEEESGMDITDLSMHAPSIEKPKSSSISEGSTGIFRKLMDSGGGGGSGGVWFSSHNKDHPKPDTSQSKLETETGELGRLGDGKSSFTAATFITGSWKNKSNREIVKMRHIGTGDSVNVLCVVQVWNRCVETVIAESNVETYSVSAEDFNSLFNHDSLVDEETFNQMRVQEVANFRMDTSIPAPTIFGVPLYMTFSCISCTVVAAKGIMAADSNLLRANTSDPYATIELVDYDTGRTVNSQWFLRTPTRRKTLNPQWFEKHTSRWRDIHLPFETLALKITLYDEDVMEDDDKLGEVYLKVSDLDLQDENCPFLRIPDERILNIKTEKAKEVVEHSKKSLRSYNGWFELGSMDSSSSSQRTNNEQNSAPSSPCTTNNSNNVERMTRTPSPPPMLTTQGELHSSQISEIMDVFKNERGRSSDVTSFVRKSFGIESVRTDHGGSDKINNDAIENWKKIKVASKFTQSHSPNRAWAGILSALKTKMGAFGPEEEEPLMTEEEEMMLEQLDAQNRGIIDMWHELLPTKEMIAQSKRTGKPLPAHLGAIRLRTWIKKGERVNYANGGDMEPDIEMNEKRLRSGSVDSVGGGSVISTDRSRTVSK